MKLKFPRKKASNANLFISKPLSRTISCLLRKPTWVISQENRFHFCSDVWFNLFYLPIILVKSNKITTRHLVQSSSLWMKIYFLEMNIKSSWTNFEKKLKWSRRVLLEKFVRLLRTNLNEKVLKWRLICRQLIFIINQQKAFGLRALLSEDQWKLRLIANRWRVRYKVMKS